MDNGPFGSVKMTRPNQWEKVNREQAKKLDKPVNVEQVPYLIIYPITAGRCCKWPHQQEDRLVCVCVCVSVCVKKREGITRIFSKMIHYFFLKINMFLQTKAAPRLFLRYFYLFPDMTRSTEECDMSIK